MKAVGLFSGGLDSLLAIKLMQEQGIDVTAISFRSPFFLSEEKKKKRLEQTAKKEGFKIKFIEMDDDYLKIVKKPKHGHGKNMNPCIDCHGYMFKIASDYAKKIKAKFLFSGEVLDERPMSQNLGSLRIVEKEAGLKGKLLRPLSAKLLEETEAENKGWIDRERLMNIKGRGRKEQFELAKKYKIDDFETPGGGCLLTFIGYSDKLKALFKHKKRATIEDVKLLRAGRHFICGNNLITIGRNEKDNKELSRLKKKTDTMLEAKDDVGPLTIIRGKTDKKTVEVGARLTARYSDAKDKEVIIKYGKEKFNKELIVNKIKEKEIEKMRL